VNHAYCVVDAKQTDRGAHLAPHHAGATTPSRMGAEERVAPQGTERLSSAIRGAAHHSRRRRGAPGRPASRTRACSPSASASLSAAVRAHLGRLSALSVLHSKSGLCGGFAWVRRALTSQNGGSRPGQSTGCTCAGRWPRESASAASPGAGPHPAAAPTSRPLSTTRSGGWPSDRRRVTAQRTKGECG
jgi:hypothetical protein